MRCGQAPDGTKNLAKSEQREIVLVSLKGLDAAEDYAGLPSVQPAFFILSGNSTNDSTFQEEAGFEAHHAADFRHSSQNMPLISNSDCVGHFVSASHLALENDVHTVSQFWEERQVLSLIFERKNPSMAFGNGLFDHHSVFQYADRQNPLFFYKLGESF
jgi:hypothetical protein